MGLKCRVVQTNRWRLKNHKMITGEVGHVDAIEVQASLIRGFLSDKTSHLFGVPWLKRIHILYQSWVYCEHPRTISCKTHHEP